MTTLVPMTEAEFASFSEESSQGYAQDKVDSGQWAREDALRLARESHRELLPQGIGTPNHYLFTVRDDEILECLGELWFARKERGGMSVAYVYAISIREKHRRKGHATRALAALEKEARVLGMEGVELHVFGHNPAAQALYAKTGYEATNIIMFKRLGAAAP
jgi:RimJ/RimL family protein N-acetyltransferase